MTLQVAIIISSVMISMYLLWIGIALVNIAKEIHKSRESEKGTNEKRATLNRAVIHNLTKNCSYVIVSEYEKRAIEKLRN